LKEKKPQVDYGSDLELLEPDEMPYHKSKLKKKPNSSKSSSVLNEGGSAESEKESPKSGSAAGANSSENQNMPPPADLNDDIDNLKKAGTKKKDKKGSAIKEA
jgi:hypothetical protein